MTVSSLSFEKNPATAVFMIWKSARPALARSLSILRSSWGPCLPLSFENWMGSPAIAGSVKETAKTQSQIRRTGPYCPARLMAGNLRFMFSLPRKNPIRTFIHEVGQQR